NGCTDSSETCVAAFGAQTYFDIYLDGQFLTGNNILYRGPSFSSADYYPPGTPPSVDSWPGIPATGNTVLTAPFSLPSFGLTDSGQHVIAFEVFDHDQSNGRRELRGYFSNIGTNRDYCSPLINLGILSPRTSPQSPALPAWCYSIKTPTGVGIYDEPPTDSLGRRWNERGYQRGTGWEITRTGNSGHIGGQLDALGYTQPSATVWSQETDYAVESATSNNPSGDVRIFCRYEWTNS
ncbi:MAG TPA: hypothetical protein VGA08_03990, partial [Candidatus Saccharimonadales bacterium]